VRWTHLLTSLVGLFFFGALVFATLHALDLVERLSIFLSVTLPTAAAAVGVILTVHQHRALAERYGRMRSRLVSVQESLRNADAQTIRKATSDAARVIAEENGDWFGAMWFHDVELPP
jgi:cell division protein FtsL